MVHHCCSKQKVKRGLWSPEEDQKLVTHITAHGHGCWSSVPKLAGLERCGKSCRLRWINYLRPDVKRGSFTEQEETTIIDVHRMLGNRWAQIAKHLPGRTDNEVKNFWNSCIKKKLLSQGFDPTTHNLLLLSSSSSSPSPSTKKRTTPPITKSNTFTVDHSTSSAAAAVSIDHHTMKTMVMNNNMIINGNSRVDHIMMTTLNDDADDDLIINTSSTTLSALLKPRETATTTASMFSSGCLISTVLNDHHQYKCSNTNWGSVSRIDHQLPFLDDQQSHHHHHHHTLQQQQQQISYGVNYNHHDDQLNMLFNSSGILDRHHQTEPDYQAQNINIKALIDGSSSITSDIDFEFVDPAFIMPPPPVYTTTTTYTCIDEQGLAWDC